MLTKRKNYVKITELLEKVTVSPDSSVGRAED